MSNSRSKNALNNLLSGAVLEIVNTLFGFISRTVFIYVLGKEYLGISGLFTSVLSILSLTELGIGSGIIYCIYKPLAEKDYKKLQAYMNIYKRAYQIIGCIILVVGLALIPFLPHIIEDSDKLVELNININLIYCMYLFQSVSSYWFFAYRGSIIGADQKNGIISRINAISTVVASILGIVALLVSRDFILYLAITILRQLLSNIITAIVSKRMYPEVWKKNNEKLTKDELKSLGKKVVGLSMYKFSGTILNSTDNLIISKYLGLAVVGVFDNYHAIIGYIRKATNLIFNSLTAGLGNVNATESPEKRYQVFRNVNYMNFWVFGFCGIALFCLYNPFISIWVGDDMLFTNMWCVFAICIDFVTSGLQQTVITHKDACGLFWEGKWRPVISGLLNLVLSLLVVKPLGVAGVIGMTTVSRMLTTWWFDPYLVFKHAFKMSPKPYYIRYIKRLLFIAAVCAANWGLCESVDLALGSVMSATGLRYIGFVAKVVITAIFPNVCFWLATRRSPEYVCLLFSVCNLLGKKLSKKNKLVAAFCEKTNKRYFELREQGVIL